MPDLYRVKSNYLVDVCLMLLLILYVLHSDGIDILTTVYTIVLPFIFFGKDGVKALLKPINKPFFLWLISSVAALQLVDASIAWLSERLLGAQSIIGHPIEASFSGHSLYPFLVLLPLALQIIFEELLSITLTTAIYSQLPKNKIGTAVAFVTSAFAMGLLHGPTYQWHLVPILAVSISFLLFSYTWYRYQSLRASIYLHFSFDVFFLLTLYLGW
ncbi:CPBP family intramembrane glutamic endopeptidase [Fructobacillus durionis]|uniref:CAAX protease self-immunity n=1 Tax=Fructobacillus durionis TaxID=283737 RepID=A0A1I1GLQ0_9LACO|nr:CPBP family intramembrane glutamic endopeptidase [Fructobacillus durionis]SFC10080.1 CAAX protease self-immunity [Fructobacillus durionis]